ncbi:MAG: BatA domain-containing protein [Phycisphaerales bacterium]|nr:BatA domain-containing protein [Planctomycetota bacterium]MCH8508845.1 BatA domain-containing protein [Phycisphaerales bacterium]
MSFLHPLILTAGLAALAIPVLVHLLRRRRKPIPWAAMRFLQEAVRKRRRRLRLEQLLLFLTRCAIVTLLALAVARPVLGGRPGSDLPTTLVLLIDDSIGSALTDDAGRTGLSRSVERARRELDAIAPMGGDRVGLLTMGAPGRAVVWPPTGDVDAVRRALDRLQPTDSGRSIGAARDALGELSVRAAAGDEREQRVVLRAFSSWRGVDPDALFAGGVLVGVDDIRLDPPETAPRENIGIRSAVPTTPTVLGGAGVLAPPAQVGVSLVRSGGSAERIVDVEVIALPGGSIAGRSQARFAPGQDRAEVSVALDDAALTPGRGGRVALEVRLPGDANRRDDTARAVLGVRRELRVGVVERPPAPGSERVAPGVWAMAALAPDERAGLDTFRIDPASLASVPAASVDALLILEPGRLGRDAWARAREVLARGGFVGIAPDADAGVTPAWAEPLAMLTEGAITLSPGGVREGASRLGARVAPGGLLAGLAGEFAELARAVTVRRTIGLSLQDGAEPSLLTEDGSVFLAGAPGPGGRGVVAVFASAIELSWTDLPARPAFVPVMQELVRRGAGLGIDTPSVAGRTPSEDPAVDRWERDAELSGSAAMPGEPGTRAGVLLGIGRDGAVTRSLAINPDAEAARTEPAPDESLRTAITGMAPGASVVMGEGPDARGPERGPVQATVSGDRLALLLLALAALLATIEPLLARAASHPEGGAA